MAVNGVGGRRLKNDMTFAGRSHHDCDCAAFQVRSARREVSLRY